MANFDQLCKARIVERISKWGEPSYELVRCKARAHTDKDDPKVKIIEMEHNHPLKMDRRKSGALRQLLEQRKQENRATGGQLSISPVPRPVRTITTKLFRVQQSKPIIVATVEGFAFPLQSEEEVDRLEYSARRDQLIRDQYVALLQEVKPHHQDPSNVFADLFSDEALLGYNYYGKTNRAKKKKAMRKYIIFTDCMVACKCHTSKPKKQTEQWFTVDAFQYVENRKGNLNLFYQGYEYLRRRVADQATMWECNKKRTCGARAVTRNGNQIKLNKFQHNHPHSRLARGPVIVPAVNPVPIMYKDEPLDLNALDEAIS
ncbi:uncharacterized protein LOC134284051 [Aedes albopictus]|uniref:FLYWCH-type domain-containing protein n=1 Tax=Aedes albopictus TaxID=7160 RepID=A0ABM1Y7A2_AEDAL